MDNETIKEILEVGIKVRTNTRKEKVIRFSDIVGCHEAMITCNREFEDYNFLNNTKFKIEFGCSDYTMEIFDV